MNAMPKTPNKSPERKALADAIAAHAAAIETVAQAEATLTKANDLHCGLQAQLAAFESLDSDIARARTERMKLALATGEHHFPADEPEGFASRIIARDNLQDHLNRVRETLPLLMAERDFAQTNVATLDIEREIAAEKVIAIEAEEMAVAFLAQLNALRSEHYRLASYHNRWRKTPTGMTQVRMSSIVMGAAMENILGDSEIHGGIRVREAIAKAMNEYWAALKSDPRAMLADFENAEPSANVVTMPKKAAG